MDHRGVTENVAEFQIEHAPLKKTENLIKIYRGLFLTNYNNIPTMRYSASQSTMKVISSDEGFSSDKKVGQLKSFQSDHCDFNEQKRIDLNSGDGSFRAF